MLSSMTHCLNSSSTNLLPDDFRQHTTFSIKSSGRHSFVSRLLSSICRFHPCANVLIADDGVVPLNISVFETCFSSLRVVRLPEDSGVSIGRNSLIENTQTPYLLYFDDDFEITDLTHASQLVKYLYDGHTDVVGGLVSDRLSYQGFQLDLKDGVLTQKPPTTSEQAGCVAVDLVPNFFAARTSSLLRVKWDPAFKLGEHEDFFLRAKKKELRVISCNCCVVKHEPDISWYNGLSYRLNTYQMRRRRAFAFMQQFLQKHDIRIFQTQDKIILAANFNKQTLMANQLAASVRQLQGPILGVTAVLVSWKRPANVAKIIRRLAQEPAVKEVVVWNNLVNEPLNRASLEWALRDRSDVTLRVKEGSENLNTEARWRACAELASQVGCYFIDDDFYPTALPALLASFRDAPTLLHSTTNGHVYLNNIRWSFVDSAHGPPYLSTGFSWVGSGALVARSVVQHFVEKQLNHIPAEMRPICDNLFAIWMNRLPLQTMVNLETGDLQQDHAYSVTPAIISSLAQARLFAFHKVAEEVLVASQHESSSSDFLQYPHSALQSFPLPLRASTHEIIFTTNVLPSAITFSDPSAIDQTSVLSYYHTASDIPDNTQMGQDYTRFLLNPPLHAIDADPTTSWISAVPVRKGMWFCLDILSVVDDMGTLEIAAQHFQHELIVEISADGVHWVPFTFLHSLKLGLCRGVDASLCKLVTYDLNGISGRFIRFVAHWDFGELFQIWHVRWINPPS
eukprot:GILI01010031.1.p1 GENE.GILI01010031.1~~GILI01010031.1.p1  ORF type:complete len:801 (-),score=63.74 GILI01010031.1:289-2499(-)